MIPERNIPTPLNVVAYLFLLMGIMSAFEILGELTHGTIRFGFGVLGIWIFFGLRRYSPGWRTCALVFIWLGMIGLAIAFIYGFLGSGPAFITVFGRRYADIPVIWISVGAGLFFPLEFWMYHVLTRPDIRILFYDEPQTPPA
jgi:hypothetical protein